MTISGMTGFSAARGNRGGTSWAWEAKSVNGRGLDVRVRVPAGFDTLEELVRQSVSKRFKRASTNPSVHSVSLLTKKIYSPLAALIPKLLPPAKSKPRNFAHAFLSFDQATKLQLLAL